MFDPQEPGTPIPLLPPGGIKGMPNMRFAPQLPGSNLPYPPFQGGAAEEEQPAPMAGRIRMLPTARAPIPQDAIEINSVKSGKYPRENIASAIRSAKAVGVDPYQYLAMVMQESGFGTERVHKNGKYYTGWSGVKMSDMDNKDLQLADSLSKSTGLEYKHVLGAVAMKRALEYGKSLGYSDEASLLQAHNGYGTLTPKALGGATKAYGIPIGDGLNMKKNPIYGKRLVELKAAIQGNKGISDMVTQYMRQ
jgi:hypothetical protein